MYNSGLDLACSEISLTIHLHCGLPEFIGSNRPLCGALNYAELSSCERVNARTAGILLAHELCIIITAFLEILSMRPTLDNGQLLPLVLGVLQVRELSWINRPRHTYEWSSDSHGLTTMQRR